MTTVALNPPRLTGRQACKVLGVSHYRLMRLAALGKVRVYAPAGFQVTYDQADVERLAVELRGAQTCA